MIQILVHYHYQLQQIIIFFSCVLYSCIQHITRSSKSANKGKQEEANLQKKEIQTAQEPKPKKKGWYKKGKQEEKEIDQKQDEKKGQGATNKQGEYKEENIKRVILRVGVTGQMAQQQYKNKQLAIKEYTKKLNQKVKKSYRLVEMNYEDDKQEKKVEESKKKQEEQEKPSELDPKVQNLIRLIFDMKMMTKQMKQIGYDANKMPLGKLAKTSILKGYQILREIAAQLKEKNRKQIISSLSSAFYSQIPHNFGFQKMANFILNTEKLVKEKLQMLQSLQDIQIFTKLLDQGSADTSLNELDSNYKKLGITIRPLDKTSSTYELLLRYVKNTHASTHTAYHLEVLQIFELEKNIQIQRYRKDIDNKQLLWHGSRLTNFVGILSQGLRIAPPQAPVTGYMFGKGVYFADMVTKSANYCFTSRDNNIGLMLLCEVALGGINQKFYADYYANLLPQGKMSTKGVGKNAPQSAQMLDDVLVPTGQGVSTGIQNSSLLYNEYIVYDIAQIKTRYLFQMKFHYH